MQISLNLQSSILIIIRKEYNGSIAFFLLLKHLIYSKYYCNKIIDNNIFFQLKVDWNTGFK